MPVSQEYGAVIQLIYTSTASPDLPSGEVFRIVQKSAANNGRDGLSGFLLFFNQRFFQVVEGSTEAIDALVRKLEADSRHHSINIISRTHIAAPHFAKWKMKRLIAAADLGSPEQIDPELDRAPQNVQTALTDFLAMQKTMNAA